MAAIASRRATEENGVTSVSKGSFTRPISVADFKIKLVRFLRMEFLFLFQKFRKTVTLPISADRPFSLDIRSVENLDSLKPFCR